MRPMLPNEQPMHKALSVFILIALGTWLGQAAAQAQQAVPSAKVRVVTRDLEPFSFTKDGRRVGYAAELWDQLARETGLEYEVSVVSTAQEIIDALKDKKADVGVGALSVTAQRESIIDFSQPFYESGLQVLVAGGGGSFADNIWPMLKNLFNLELIGMFLLLLGTMVLISYLVWLYEHPINEDQWPKDKRRGLWESFWWTVSTLLVGGADNKGPVGVGGRIVAIVWMLLSIVLVSLLTASFTTTLTINTLKGDINGPADLPGRKVSTVKGSTAEAWLNAKGAQVRAETTVGEAIAALRKGSVQAVVFDAPVLQYEAAKAEDTKLQMVGQMFERQNYAFALQQDSELVERLNQGLLLLHERGMGTELRKKYFGIDQ